MKNHNTSIDRRQFVKTAGAAAVSATFASALPAPNAAASDAVKKTKQKPNLVYVFADQWRAQATGYAGDQNVKTPNLDKLAAQSVNFTNAVSCCPVCSPHRASLLTGRYPLTHGVFLNDVRLNNDAVSIAQAYKKAGYKTAYIGKWHLDGPDRAAPIPKQRRQGFDFWMTYGCTHNYYKSSYWTDKNQKIKWPGYDAYAQTKKACNYIKQNKNSGPFVLFLSWGPPHAPYRWSPPDCRQKFNPTELNLRQNVPPHVQKKAATDLAGYYAHITALDQCINQITQTIQQAGIEKNTILTFSSDHGDMLYSHGMRKKQKPWDESIRVPFLLRYPAAHGSTGKIINMPINSPDIMPTLLALSGVEIPPTVEGTDFSSVITGSHIPRDNPALITCPSPFGQWRRDNGGKEYRGLRTKRYTYVRDLNGPWLLYDNEKDPCQINNLCNKHSHLKIQNQLDDTLAQKLRKTNDDFLPGWEYIRKWGYAVDSSGTIPYEN